MTDDFAPSVEVLRDVAGSVSHARLRSKRLEGGRTPLVVVEYLEPAALRAPSPLRGSWLVVRHFFRAAPDQKAGNPRRIETTAYLYALRDRRGVELLAWHWQPGPRFLGPDHPHVHVSASLRPWANDAERGLLPLDKRHLPTGAVSLAEVVRTLVDEFGIRPLRADWRERLTALPPI